MATVSPGKAELLVALTRLGWGRSNPAFRRVFTTQFIPGGSDAQMAWFDELQRSSCSGEHAADSRAVRYAVDVSDLAATITVPTLVLHARDDAVVAFHLSNCYAKLGVAGKSARAAAAARLATLER